MGVDVAQSSHLHLVVLLALLSSSVLIPLLLGGGGGNTLNDGEGTNRNAKLPLSCSCQSSGGKDEGTTPQPIPRKDVVILIDALRPDVLNNASCFPRFHKYVSNGRVWQRRLEASAPTVTLPKIRTIVTGREGCFMDVLWNFFAERLVTIPSDRPSPGAEDELACGSERASSSLLHLLSCVDKDLAAVRRRRIAFYGDNTWLKLYPESSNVFVRSEGVASFDVSDSVVVDSNVTRRVEVELKQWSLPPTAETSDMQEVDLLLLHYLGYDHIGHTEDPRTSLRAKEKLSEMDVLIEHLVENVCWSSNAQSAVYVISDHGMALKGGHGGASTLERSTTFARIGCRRRSQLSMDLEREELDFQSRQVDASAMLALGLGLVDPGSQSMWTLVLPNSLGLPLPSFISTLLEDEVEAAYVMQCMLLHSLTGATLDSNTICRDVATAGGMKAMLQRFANDFKPAQERLYAAASRSSTSASQKWWRTAICVMCLAASLGEVTVRLHSSGDVFPDVVLMLHLGIIVAQGAVSFSSSFVEEEPFVVYGLFSLGILVMVASIRSADFGRRRLSLLLIGAACIRACALSLCPQGVKWKDLVEERPQPADGELVWYALLDWKSRFSLPLNSLAQFLDTQPLEQTLSIVRLLLENNDPLLLTALCGTTAVVLMRWRRSHSLSHVVILVAFGCTVPLSSPLVLCYATVVFGAYCCVVALSATSRWSLVLLPLLVDVCHFSFGRSIHLNDVVFAHLLPSFVAADDSLLHWVGGPLVFLWHHCGHAAAVSVIAWNYPRHLLRRVMLSCLLREVALTSFCGLMAIWMEGHIFYWSVFLNKVLFCLLDCVFYGVVGLLATFL